MKCPPPLPDLSKLTEAQKDVLIVDLWETLVAIEGAREAPGSGTGGGPSLGPSNAGPRPAADILRERIRHTAPSRRAQALEGVPIRLGQGLRLFKSKVLLFVLAAIGLGFAADWGASWYQRRLVAERAKAALVLENIAFGSLYAELSHIAYEPDGKSYRATLNMQNTNPDVPLYVMLIPARVFAQTGMIWQEVPSSALGEQSQGVVRLDGARQYSLLFQAGLRDFAELIPGYMHMRIESDMLISSRAEPKDDIVARNNRFYVYLKPQGSDDAAIKRRGNFPGTLPIFIPMPPH
ncbi:MAG: hypothetical protein L0Y57_06450 [Beijerinckiaceae bacterium]|nr:hypothetical protein [Beijerinckiaceae bacterium]